MQLTRPPWTMGRNDPCFCGSGERYRRCCGSTQPDRRIPHGIVVQENFLSLQECREVTEFAAQQSSSRLQIMDKKKSTADTVVRSYHDSRVTQRVDMSARQDLLDELVLRAIRTRIEPDMDCRVEWFEQPQLLKYEQGGFYSTHADSENFIREQNHWQRVMDRDVSLLLYLDDDYEGGELSFRNFDYQLRPRAGMLVYFPSDSRYKHKAMEVTSGVRHAIVSWMSLMGVEKLRPMPDNARLVEPGP